MQSTNADLAVRRRLTSKKMHESLAASSRRVADRRDRSLQMAAKCKAAIRPSQFFTKLPPEIRLMIYDFAYGGEGGSITVNLKRKAVAGRKALSCAFDPLIAICKEWFNEAFDSFVRSRQFNLGACINNLNDVFSCLSPQIRENITAISWRLNDALSWPYDIACLHTFAPRVKILNVFIADGAPFTYSRCLMKRFWNFFGGVMSLRGLRSFHAAVNEPKDIDTSLRNLARSWFDKNVATLNQTIHDHVTKPNDS